MLVNLIGTPLTVHPYVDEGCLSFLTIDRRVTSNVEVPFSGLVYEQHGMRAQTLIDSYHVSGGLIHTTLTLEVAKGKRYYCGHVWRFSQHEDAAVRQRVLKAHLDQDLLTLTLDEAPQIAVALGTTLAPQAEISRTLWDHLIGSGPKNDPQA